MKTLNITQVRRIVFRKKTSSDASWTSFTIEPEQLGQDTTMSVNIAPRKSSRASARGTTTRPIAGTIDSFEGSITFIADNFKILGKAIDRWNAATYTGADPSAGQITDGADSICDSGEYWSVIAQGICDDGSAADVELTRCFPSVDDALEFGSGDAQTVTLALNPQLYDAAIHGSDGYPAYSYRFGENNTAKAQRLNATTGNYDDVDESE